MKSFLCMLGFFTRIPVRPSEIDDTVFKKGIKYLFVVALIIGIPTSLIALLGQWIGQYVAALLALLCYLIVSGGLHIDGLADTFDAFGSNRDRDRTLEIMKDSHVGTFGVLAVCVYVVGMVLLMARVDYIAIGLFPLVGRIAALLCARLFGYARKDGMGKGFLDGVKTIHIVVALLVYALIAFVFCVQSKLEVDIAALSGRLVSLVISCGITLYIVSRMAKKLGGVTGDVIGFSIESTQFLYLLISFVIISIR